MNRGVGYVVTVAALMAVAGAGLWAGQTGLLRLPLATRSSVASSAVPAAAGPILYYRDPDGKQLFSDAPKMTADGRAYLPVRDGEDVSFNAVPVARGTVEKKIKFYRNPMGLPDTSPTPKKDSMGMDYIPVYEGEDDYGDTVKVSPGKIQRTGVETVVIGRRPITRTIKAPGVVQLDERRIVVVAPRFDGFVDHVGAVTSGAHIMKGESLMTVFGQELLNQGARLIVEENASLGHANEGAMPSGVVREGGVIGAERRLENLGAPAEFIAAIKRDRRVPDDVVYRSPINGVVLERNAVDGQGFKAGDTLFRLADHSVVWVMADVAEADMDAVKPGQPVTVTARARPGRTFSGTVAAVYPHLMKETRSVRVRIELPNRDLALLPDMYGEVEIGTGGNETVLAVPASAIIDSGSRQVVLVDKGEGRFAPREVKSGRKGDGFVEVKSGVAEGDKVVVNGNFLIDAESNLQSALKGFSSAADKEVMQ